MKKISLFLPDLRGGGAEKVAINLANEISLHGFSVDIVLIRKQGELLASVMASVNIIDLNVDRVRSAIKPYIVYLREVKPDVILAMMWPLTSIAVVANKLAYSKCRVIISEHTTWSRSHLVKKFYNRWITRLLMRLTFPFADDIITVSYGAADDLAEFSFSKRTSIKTIYNPIVDAKNTNKITSESVIKFWPTAQFSLLSVGALKPVKDFETLLKAFSLVRKKMDVSLVILGEGKLREDLLKLADRLEITPYISLPGFFNDTSKFYQHADLFVLTSTAEGFGNVIVEALSHGTPVVSTDCKSGPKEILEGGKYGKLVPVGDIEAIASAMIISLQECHDINTLKQRAMDFSIDRITNQYLRVMFPDSCQKQLSSFRNGMNLN